MFKHYLKFISILLMASLLVFTSCAGKKGKTNSTFKLTLGGISSVYITGGLMLYGKMLNGPSRFGKRIDASGTATLELNNGNWEFFAIAWDGASDMQVASVLRCGKSVGNFTGGDATVSLNLDNATCNDSIFHKDTTKIDTTTFAPNVAFPQTSFMTCDREWVTAPAFYASFNCDGAGFGAVDSYKVFLPEFIDNGGGAQIVNLGLQSDCKATNPSNTYPTISGSGATANMVSRFPIGRPGSPFFTMVKGYFGSTDCGNTKVARGFLDRIFPEGIGTAPLGFHDTGTTNFRLFDQIQDSEVCGVTGGAANPGDFFSSGNGQGHPYAICSREQFEAFANATNYNSTLPDDAVALRDANFRLYANIDFAGSAFNGIGDGATGYTGDFEGRKYVISNIFNMSLTDIDNIGVFRFIGPEAKIDNLTLRNIFFECSDTDSSGDCQRMGTLAGWVMGGTAAATQIINVKAQGNVFGAYRIGGLIGEVSSGSLGTNIQDVHFAGAAEAEQFAGESSVGGLIGRALSGVVQVSDSSSYCHVYGQGKWAGGLIGSFTGTGTSSVLRSSARCEVRADKVIGGLVGLNSSTVSDSYAFPALQAHCNGGCDANTNKASIGGLVGENTGSVLKSFTAYTYINMNSGPGSADAMAFAGGLVGYNNAGTCPTNSFFTKMDNNSSNTFGATPGGGCGTYLNSTSIYNIATYTGWTIVNATTAGPLWNLSTQAEGFDVPRLSWEYNKQLEVPYLQRPCESNGYIQTGSGSAADPLVICTMTDFLAMGPGSYYRLKKDLEFLGAPLTAANKFGAGVYNLDGDDYSIIGLSTELTGSSPSNIGLFNSLNAGSRIANIGFVGLNLKLFPGTIAMNATGLMAGLLAGVNQGTIENVWIDNSELRLSMSNSSFDNVSPKIGGLVGTNSGLIQYVYGGPHVSINDTNIYLNGGETLYVGGLVGRNLASGQIKYAGLYSSVNNNANATGFNAKPNEHYYASVVAYNSGLLEQVSAEGRVEIWNFDNNNAGGVFAGIAAKNDGVINNAQSQVTFRLSNGGSASQFAGVVAQNLSGGSVSKSYYAPSEWDMNDFGLAPFLNTGTVAVSAGTNLVVGSGTFFTTELASGDYVLIAGEYHQVGTITSDTMLNLVTNHSAGSVGYESYSATTSWPRASQLGGVVLSNSGAVSDSYCFANSNAGEPNEGMSGCLDIHPVNPNFNFFPTSGGFTLFYDDASTSPMTLSSIGWDVDDDFLYGVAIWTIEDYDRPPRLRVADPFREEVLNAEPIF